MTAAAPRAAARGAALALAAAVPAAATPALAQRPSPAAPVPELRAGVAAGRTPSALAGAGVFLDAGLYARLGVTAAAGAAWVDAPGGRRTGAAGEAAVVGRFLLDPLRQAPRGVYAGGGLGVRLAEDPRDDGARGGGWADELAARPFLFGVVGVEGRRTRGGLAPAVELGVGGGVRLTVVLRRARAGRR